MDKYLYDKSRSLYRIPPFRDSHMHLLCNGRPLKEEALSDIMDVYARHGIFEVFDMGHKSGIGLKARELWKGRLRVRTAVSALYKKGGYGSFLGICLGNKEDIRTAVRTLAGAGGDFIKVINSGLVDIAGGGVTEGGFTKEDLKLICSESAARELAVSCHANGDDAIRIAVEAGISSIEHGFFVSEQTLRMMAEQGVAWTPTAYALLSLVRSFPAEQKAYIEEVVAKHLESIGYAASAGVRMRIGTDSGSADVAHGSSFIEELRLFRRAGLSVERIIEAACMDETEIVKGSYLVVAEDFIENGRIEGIFREKGMSGPVSLTDAI